MTEKRKINPNSLKNLEKGKFKKGQSGNPSGKPKNSLSAIISELKEQGFVEPTPNEIIKVYKMIVTLPEDATKKLIADKSQPMLVRILGKSYLGGKGFDILERMLDRSIGRASQSMDITSGGEKLKVEPLRIEVIDNREQVDKKEE